jgi:DnaJ-class molecular chaperone
MNYEVFIKKFREDNPDEFKKHDPTICVDCDGTGIDKKTGNTPCPTCTGENKKGSI